MTTENIFYFICLIICNFLYLINFTYIETKHFSPSQMIITSIVIMTLWWIFLKNNEYSFILEIGVLFLAGLIGQTIAILYKYIKITLDEKVN